MVVGFDNESQAFWALFRNLSLERKLQHASLPE